MLQVNEKGVVSAVIDSYVMIVNVFCVSRVLIMSTPGSPAKSDTIDDPEVIALRTGIQLLSVSI